MAERVARAEYMNAEDGDRWEKVGDGILALCASHVAPRLTALQARVRELEAERDTAQAKHDALQAKAVRGVCAWCHAGEHDHCLGAGCDCPCSWAREARA